MAAGPGEPQQQQQQQVAAAADLPLVQGGDTPQQALQPVLFQWEPLTSVQSCLSTSAPREHLSGSGVVLRTAAAEMALPSFALSAAAGTRSSKQEGAPLQAEAASEPLPFFSVCSDSAAPHQQDVLLIPNSEYSEVGGTLLAAAAAAAAPAADADSSSSASPAAGQQQDSSSSSSKASVALELLEEGHTLCCSCRGRLSVCPTCRSPELSIRCRALEVLAQCLTDIPCRFASFGCTYTMKYTEAPQHESRCLRRPLACLHADNGCAFEASPHQLAEHLLQQHGYEYKPTSSIQFACTPSNCRGSKRLGPSAKASSSSSSSTGSAAAANGSRQQQQQQHQAEQAEEGREEEPAFSLDGCESFVWQQQLYHCFGKYFVLRVHRRVEAEASFYISLLALHPRHHCSRYSLQVSGNHRTYSFHGPVWSAARGPQELERVKDCLLLPENIALFLSGAKGSEQNLNSINLNITGEILPS
ncbi:hypothetical protein Efla_007326 [Eimeria flavescens]